MTQAQPARQLVDDRRSPHVPTPAAGGLARLVDAARAGDTRAWEELHTRLTPTLRAIARGYRLSTDDIDDAVQATWVALVTSIGRVRDPAAVSGWLATTVRRECLRLLQRPVREIATDEPTPADAVDAFADPERALLEAERRAAVHSALRSLPERQRLLMTLMVAEPAIDYATISATLSMPQGSIGPVRARSLARLRAHPELSSLGSSAMH